MVRSRSPTMSPNLYKCVKLEVRKPLRYIWTRRNVRSLYIVRTTRLTRSCSQKNTIIVVVQYVFQS